MMTTNLIAFADTATEWQRVLCAFLAEKEQRSGSHHTIAGCLKSPETKFSLPLADVGKQGIHYQQWEIP